MHALTEHLSALDGAVQLGPEHGLTVLDEARLRAGMGQLARASALGEGEARAAARWLIWAAAQALGAWPASINDLYLARGRGETPTDFTVPAMNLRALAFESARAVFRAAQARQVGAMIFELARSEMGYTDQRPDEYVASVLAAAVAEGHRGPVFIQGDHFQVSAKRYTVDPETELAAVRDLTAEAIAAGFYNIDVDTSTLVDLGLPGLAEQQALNAGLCAELTRWARRHGPAGVTLSMGGEIGEVGGKNSTEAELDAFMTGYNHALGEGSVGLSKISIQTGTSHGGVVLPDGSLAQVKVDFDTLAQLSRIARERYGLAGAVQHGASTLPETAFRAFADSGACEVHLATNFQNMFFDRLPGALREEMYAWLLANKAGERKDGESDEQFVYKNRKHCIGPFKAACWSLDAAILAGLGADWEAQFGFLFEQLNVVGTLDLVLRHVEPVPVAKAPGDFGVGEATLEAVEGLAD
jgi:fructose/tagatose bisphosphate aldolase